MTKDGSMGFMVPHVRPIPTRFLTNILYTPLDNTPLQLYQMCDNRGPEVDFDLKRPLFVFELYWWANFSTQKRRSHVLDKTMLEFKALPTKVT